MKKLVLFNFVLLVGVSSCKKDKEPVMHPAPHVASGNCFPTTTGSYWIYERFDLDTNGVETTVSIDSSYVSGDTIIHGDTFTVFVGTVIDPSGIAIRRDSSGYVLDQFWIIHFSKTNFSDVLWSGSVSGYHNYSYKMMWPPVMVSTPAGSIPAYDYMGTINIVVSGYPWESPRYIHNYFADGIGLIRETTFFLMGPNYIGRKLIRYHIE